MFAWLREQRLVNAQSLLKRDQLQIQQIAAQVGFKRVGDFSTAFKRRYGLTPREYRMRQQRVADGE